MPENASINRFEYVRALNIFSQYSYNNIIIVTNVIILEFLSAPFVHPRAVIPFCLSLTRVRT